MSSDWIRPALLAAMDPFFDTLAFYSRVAHHAELGAVLLAGFMTLSYFARRV